MRNRLAFTAITMLVIVLAACVDRVAAPVPESPTLEPSVTDARAPAQTSEGPTPLPVVTTVAAPTPTPSTTPSPGREPTGVMVDRTFLLSEGESALLKPGEILLRLLEVRGNDDTATVTATRNGQEIGHYVLEQGGAQHLGGMSLKLLFVSRPQGGVPSAQLIAQTGPVDQLVVDANNSFAFDLLAEQRRQEGDRTLFISPLSITMALAMAYNGAAGETRDAMAEAMRLDRLDREALNRGNAALLGKLAGREPDLQLVVANSVWAREGFPFQKAYFDRVAWHYGAEVASLPFDSKALERINGWVAEKTRGKIDSILDEIHPNDVMYLINAIYFKGGWRYEFDEKKTEEGTFNNFDGSTVQVPMMHRSPLAKFDYLDGDGFAALRLPYRGNASMYVFLPDRESSLSGFLDGLDAAAWERWMQGFEHDGSGTIAMPRFELEYGVTLNDALKAMGMAVAFEGGADLSDMGPGDLYIDRVVHKAVVEVHEKGTEAAAATIVVIPVSGSAFTFEFIVDRPFFFAITDDETGALLFVGVVHELEGS